MNDVLKFRKSDICFRVNGQPVILQICCCGSINGRRQAKNGTKYIFIPIDIFREINQNKSINTKQEAWLTFLSTEELEQIVELIEKYPEFPRMYGDLYHTCLNVEKVMEMFSK